MKIKSLSFLVCLFVFLGLFQSCKQDNRIALKSYYYPTETLDNGLVYEYANFRNGQSANTDYWYFRNIKSEEKLFLVGQNYGPDFIPNQFVREEILESGSLIREGFLLTAPDSLGLQQKTMFEVKQKSVFPFFVKDSLGVFIYEINFEQKEDVLLNYNIIRNRRYLGQEHYNYNGKEIDCAVFEIKELYEIESDGVQTFEFRGKEYYGKGIGLVYQRKAMGENVQELKLVNQFSMEELEKKAGRVLKSK